MNLPYAPIKQVGNWYFVSGQIGKNMTTNEAQDDVIGQTRQLFANLDEVLATAELSKEQVVKTTVFLTNMDDFAAMNDVYREYFAAPYPARSTVAVNELPRVADKPMLVEIEAIAYRET